MTVRLVACLLLLAIVGCAEPVGKVGGKVTYKNAPVADGSVIFQNANGTVSVSGNLTPEGTYTIATAERAGLPPGDYKVAVSPNKIGTGEVVLAAPPGEAAPRPTVPVKYHSIETTDLQASVKAGENPPFDFDLKD